MAKHKWKNAPTIIDLQQAVSVGMVELSSHINDVTIWLQNLNTTGVTNKNAEGEATNRSTIEPKLIRKHAEWRYASLSEPFHTADTLFQTQAVSFEDQPLVEQDQSILAHQMQHYINKLKLVDDTVRADVDEGTAILQVGWSHKEEEIEVQVDSEDGYGNIVTEPLKITQTVHSHPTIELLEYDAIIIDPNAKGDIANAQYAIVRRSDTLAAMIEDGSYHSLDEVEALGSQGLTTFNNSPTADSFADVKRNEIEVLEYWGYWDIEDNDSLVPIVITFIGNVIVKEVVNPFPDGKLPFVIIHYLPVRGSNFGQPDGVLLEDNQRITGALMRGMIDLMGKSAVGQTGFSESALDPVNKLRFYRGEDYVFRDDVDPNKIIYQHTYPEIPASALNLLAQQAQEAESLTGVNTMGQGVSSASLGNGSATAAKGALSSASKREAGILRRIAAGFEEVARKIILMNHHFLDEDAVVAITNMPYISPKQSETELVDIKVRIRTAEADNAAAQDLGVIMQTVGNSIDPKLTQIILGKMLRLKGLPDLAHSMETFEPAPDPMAQEMQRLEIELLKAKLANEQAMSNERNTQAEYNTARAGTEQERSRKLGSEADKTNLDFVEQETGTEHERARDLLKVQAEGNMHLKALEQDFNTAKENNTPKPNNNS